MDERFIVVEGVEGAGKTTQVRLLSSWLSERRVRHVVAREPGGTPVGEAIRSVVLDRPDLPVSASSELLLILAARAAFVREVVRPTLERGETVVSDRYDFSTLAYQGFGRGVDLKAVRTLNEFATGGLHADVVLILDVPVDVGQDRQRRDGKALDRMEREGTQFLERVRAGYLSLAGSEDGAYLIDAQRSEEEVHGQVIRALEAHFQGTFARVTD